LLAGDYKNQADGGYNPQNLKRKRPGNGYGVEGGFCVRSLRDTRYQNHQSRSEVFVSAIAHYYQYDAQDASSCIPNLLASKERAETSQTRDIPKRILQLGSPKHPRCARFEHPGELSRGRLKKELPRRRN
jgi:hypothetical protein